MKKIAHIATLAIPMLVATMPSFATSVPPPEVREQSPQTREGRQQREEYQSTSQEERRRMAIERKRRADMERFNEFDRNKDGKITLEEAMVSMREKFEMLDRDKDGFVTLAEIEATVQDQRQNWAAQTPEIRQALANPALGIFSMLNGAVFRFVDANRDGKVSFEEARPFLEGMFRALDTNADSVIDSTEPNFMPGQRSPRSDSYVK
jgi:Ca2+-binding EF-hand superfamily protein